MDGNRIRRGTVRGAAAAACLLSVGTIGPSAEAAPTAASRAVAVASDCGSPVLKVWYDSDQFGTYLKAWFETDRGCPKGRRVASLSGKIYCFKPKSKLVYSANVASKKAPASTLIQALPPKNKCKTFYAESTIVYTGSGRDFKDTWRWDWGGYPA